jgi:tetratricopeptide (TPR) repeat protein
MRQVRARDPLTPMFIWREADFLLLAGEADAAEAGYEQAIAADPDDARPWFRMAELRHTQGRFDEAINARRRGHEAMGDHTLEDVLATARGASGYAAVERRAARLELDAIDAREASGSYASPLDRARAWARLGEAERALFCLDAAFADGCAGLVFLNVDPAWTSLRSDPRFDAAVQLIGLP